MSNSVKKNSIDAKDIFYANSLEYLSAELEKLDLLLKYHFEREISRGVSKRDNIPADIFVSASQIENLLKKKDGGIEPDENFESLLLEIQNKENEILNKLKVSREKGVYLPFDILQQLFNLGYHEIQILIIALAPVIDSKYERVYAYFNDSVSKNKPSIQLLYKLFCHGPDEIVVIRELVSPFYPLVFWKMIHMVGDERSASASTMFEIDDRISDFLLENKYLDPVITDLMDFNTSHEDEKFNSLNDEQKIFFENFVNLKNREISQGQISETLLLFTGENHFDKKVFSFFLGTAMRQSLISIDWNLLLQKNNVVEFLNRIFRESLLFNSIVSFNHVSSDVQINSPIIDEILRLSSLCKNTIILNPGGLKSVTYFLKEKQYYSLNFPLPGYKRRVDIWNEKINGTVIKFAENLAVNVSEQLAENYVFSEEQIGHSLLRAKNNSMKKLQGNGEISYHELLSACAGQCLHELGSLGVKIEQTYTLEDVVLPPAQKESLKELIRHSSYKRMVFNDWGFEKKIQYGSGLTVLFSGPSGTGKTMSASIIARELSRDLYKIDLSAVVSKYIGETEKNLSKIFDEARKANVVLFFDEADALFGKRTDISNSHDRYANIEISYLLQKMEEYDGVTILATNLGQNIDEAFKRRIQFMIEFPFPDISERQKIWENIFPSGAPLETNIDFSFLAGKVEVSGGYIKNIALSAAFYAAPENRKISMNHILRAVQKEYKKLSKSFLRTDFQPYYDQMLIAKEGA